jgi:hypothetical protein
MPGTDIQVPPESINGDNSINVPNKPMIMSNSPALNRIESGARSSISSVSSTVVSRRSRSIAFSSTALLPDAVRVASGGFAAGTSSRLDIFPCLGNGGSLFVSKPLFSIFRGETSIGFGDGLTVARCAAF